MLFIQPVLYLLAYLVSCRALLSTKFHQPNMTKDHNMLVLRELLFRQNAHSQEILTSLLLHGHVSYSFYYS